MTHTSSFPTLVNTEALWRAWAQGIETSFLALGWERTTDTGGADLATAPFPGTNVAAPWVMLRSTDALSATFPLIVRLEFRRGSGSQPMMALALGSATDGAGNYVGSSIVFNNQATPASTSAPPIPSFFSGHGGRYAAAVGVTAADVQLYSIERSRDANGAETDDYVTLMQLGTSAATGNHCQVLTKTGAKSTLIVGVGAWLVALPSGVNAALLNTAHVSPVFPPVGRLDRPGLNFVAMKYGDFSHQAPFTVEAYGQTHEYFAICSSNTGLRGMHTSGKCAIGLLWE